MNTRFNPDLDTVYDLPQVHSWQRTRHRFDEESVWAVRAALAARRPLLIRGEPGVGKSQLARAAAHVLNVPFLYHVVNARCESTELLYKYDAVSRLAQAQVLGSNAQVGGDWKEHLKEDRFVIPGCLWWAFDWKSALDQCQLVYRSESKPKRGGDGDAAYEPQRPDDWSPKDGSVILIDEVDKADTDFSNGLLESLGNTGFQVPITGQVVSMPENAEPPLVIVTTNEERELPAAFIRRCLVLHMSLGEAREQQKQFLLNRARDHFSKKSITDSVCEEAAEQLLRDREEAERLGPTKPGAAEYLDLLRVLVELYPGKTEEQKARLETVRRFAFLKNVREAM